MTFRPARDDGKPVAGFTQDLFEILYRNPIRTFWLGMVLIAIATAGEFISEAIATDVLAYFKQLWHGYFTIIVSVGDHLLRDFGISAVIASILAFSIEKKATEEGIQVLKKVQSENSRQIKDLDLRMNQYARKIATSVLNGVFGTLLPVGFFQSFVDIVYEESFLRDFTDISFEIHEFNRNEVRKIPLLEDFVQVKVNLHYEIKNISREKKTFPIEIFLEKTRIRSLDERYVKITYLEIGKLVFTEDDAVRFDKNMPDTELYKIYEYNIDLEPDGVSEIKLWFNFVKRKKDAVVWTNLYGTSRFDVTFTFDSANYIGGVAVYHPTRAYNKHEAYSSKSPKTISIQEPCLPYTTIELFWEPKEWLSDFHAKIEPGRPSGMVPEAS